MASQGSPQYLFCAAENREQKPCLYCMSARPDDSLVAVFACRSPRQCRAHPVIAASIPVPGVNMFHAAGQFLLSFGARPAQELARAGYSKADVKKWVWENAPSGSALMRRSGVLAEPCATGATASPLPDLATLSDDTLLPMVRDVGMIHVAVIGGDSQWWMGFSPGWGNSAATPSPRRSSGPGRTSHNPPVQREVAQCPRRRSYATARL